MANDSAFMVLPCCWQHPCPFGGGWDCVSRGYHEAVLLVPGTVANYLVHGVKTAVPFGSVLCSRVRARPLFTMRFAALLRHRHNLQETVFVRRSLRLWQNLFDSRRNSRALAPLPDLVAFRAGASVISPRAERPVKKSHQLTQDPRRPQRLAPLSRIPRRGQGQALKLEKADSKRHVAREEKGKKHKPTAGYMRPT